MDKRTALQALGLDETASTEEIQAALTAKKQDVATKKASAPTDALKAKFETIEAKLADAEKALSADPGRSQPAGDNAPATPAVTPASSSVTPAQAGVQNPSPLSQTKLADLPGLAPQDAAQVELQPGQIIANRYEIKELIGQGGMGAVYRAYDKNTDRDIALKLLLPSLLKNGSARERFLSEAKISQQLSHPNIVNVFDVQSASPADGSGDLFFLTMELLEGQDLRQWLENLKTVNQPTPIDEVKRIASELCDALSYAHEFTVHRDIKPENIWLDESGKVKLMDFGIARVQSASQRTQTGAAMGTAYYMAPEQLQGRELDARADIYAIGVMLYEMLTGQIPAGRFEPAITLRKEIGKPLSAIIDKALSVNPEQRFANAAELKTALQSGKAGKVAKVKSARPASAANLHGGGPNKLAIAVVLLLFIGGGAFAWQQGWLDALKPLDKELIAQQKADATKLLGQIKSLQRLLDDSLRDLDRDVSDAKRENSKRYATLQTWQDNAEDFISRSATLTDLQGELAVGEGYLRDDKTASKAVATLAQVKQGYEGLLSCFDNLEGFENQQAELTTLQSQWQGYGIGGDVAGEVRATEKQMAEAVAKGQECQTVNLTREAIAGYRDLIKQAAPVLVADKEALQAKSDWQAYKKKYGFTGKSPSAVQAQQHYDEANQNRRNGELATSLSLFQQAQQQWQSAPRDEAVVAQVGKQEAAWAEAERQRQAAAAAEAERQRQAAATAAEAERRALIARAVGKLVQIPAGSFNMGSNNGESDETPVHRVSVKPFSMQEHEVTFAQWDACVSAGGCSHKPGDQGWGRGNRPVIGVSWNDITQQFIPWLNKATGQKFRLPSEAEREYAARAGSTTEYSWGDNISCSQARYGRRSGGSGRWSGECSNSKDGTVPVKSFSPNRFGLYDMHGNVKEWVQDCWNASYSGAPTNGAAWTSGDCSVRVVRDGSWYFYPVLVRSANRSRNSASNRDFELGFRLVQDR